jgi:hypothetical protein
MEYYTRPIIDPNAQEVEPRVLRLSPAEAQRHYLRMCQATQQGAREARRTAPDASHITDYLTVRAN